MHGAEEQSPAAGARTGAPVLPGLESLRARILARRDSLPARLRQVADFALAHGEDIAFGTTASLAVAAGVQPSTLVRFARSMGFEGFSALQAAFRDPLRRRLEEDAAEPRPRLDPWPDPGIGPRVDPEAESTAVFAAAADAIARTAAAIPTDRFAAAANLLAGAATIHLIARRRSFPLTSYMAYAFGRMRIRCELSGSALGIEDEILAMAGPGDAAIAISFAPYAPETLRRVAALCQRGLPVVALTDGRNSPLHDVATLTFALPQAGAEDARSLPAGMAFAVALTQAVERARTGAARGG